MNSEITRADVDYITVTARLSQTEGLYLAAREVARTLEYSFDAKPWRFFGYQGWIYNLAGSGHFAYGESTAEVKGSIVQASGSMAARSWYLFNCAGSRVTRLDLAVDAKPFEPQPDVALECYQWILDNNINARKYNLIQGNLGGQTLYVGARQSDAFGRLYDKSAQSGKGELGELWRYEVELKAGIAKKAFADLLSLTGGKSNIDGSICATVYDWFDRRQVPPIFRRNSVVPIGLKVVAEETSEERKVLWLKTQVSPTVRQLILSGNREVLSALGITEFFNLEKKSTKH